MIDDEAMIDDYDCWWLSLKMIDDGDVDDNDYDENNDDNEDCY